MANLVPSGVEGSTQAATPTHASTKKPEPPSVVSTRWLRLLVATLCGLPAAIIAAHAGASAIAVPHLMNAQVAIDNAIGARHRENAFSPSRILFVGGISAAALFALASWIYRGRGRLWAAIYAGDKVTDILSAATYLLLSVPLVYQLEADNPFGTFLSSQDQESLNTSILHDYHLPELTEWEHFKWYLHISTWCLNIAELFGFVGIGALLVVEIRSWRRLRTLRRRIMAEHHA
jgi:hypothetical protein